MPIFNAGYLAQIQLGPHGLTLLRPAGDANYYLEKQVSGP